MVTSGSSQAQKIVRVRVGGATDDEALRVLIIRFKTACAALTFQNLGVIIEMLLNAPEGGEEEEGQSNLSNIALFHLPQRLGERCTCTIIAIFPIKPPGRACSQVS